MVLANTTIGKKFSKYPFLYRVHEDPDEADVEKFVKMIAGVTFPIAQTHPRSFSFQEKEAGNKKNNTVQPFSLEKREDSDESFATM